MKLSVIISTDCTLIDPAVDLIIASAFHSC